MIGTGETIEESLVIEKSAASEGYEELTHSELVSLMREVYMSAQNMTLSAEEYISLFMREYNIEGEAYNEIPYDPEKYPVTKREELQNLITHYLLHLQAFL